MIKDRNKLSPADRLGAAALSQQLGKSADEE